MKIIVDINDSKAEFFMDILKNFSSVKAERITPKKVQLVKESVEYINLLINN